MSPDAPANGVLLEGRGLACFRGDRWLFRNLDVDIHTKNNRAPHGGFELDHASGHLRVEVCPEKLKAGIFDFWGTNILFAIMPKLDPKNESKINCIIANFQLDKGVMTPEALGIDTTRLRVIIDGVIDFQKNIVDLKLVPKAKRPEFLRAGLRLGVKGTLDEPKVDVGRAPVLRSLGGMAGSTLLFPGKLFLQKRLPLDGSDVCGCQKKE